MVLRGTQRWEKILQLHDEIEKANDQLRVIGSQVEIKHDYDLVSNLINKLHFTYQEDWDSYMVKNSENDTPVWDMFIEFLEEKNDHAIQSKMRCMTTGASKTDSTKPCPNCSKVHPADQECRRNQALSNRKTPTATGTMRSNLVLADVTSRELLNKYVTEAKKVNGPCPCCKKQHTFEKNFSFGKDQVPT